MTDFKPADLEAFDPDDMDIGEFVAQTKQALDEFEKNHRAESAKDPEGWPLRMPKEDWEEQIVASFYDMI